MRGDQVYVKGADDAYRHCQTIRDLDSGKRVSQLEHEYRCDIRVVTKRKFGPLIIAVFQALIVILIGLLLGWMMYVNF